MTKNEFEGLRIGDVVRPTAVAEGFIVTNNYGNRITAVRTVDITNPDEWLLLRSNNPSINPLNRTPSAASEEKTQMEITGNKDESRFLIREIRKALQKSRTSREVALAITKLQEAEFWLGEASFGDNSSGSGFPDTK